jgi:hypothetical protein
MRPVVALLISLADEFLAAAWIYHRVHGGLGYEITEAVIALLALFILALSVIGLELGFARSAPWDKNLRLLKCFPIDQCQMTDIKSVKAGCCTISRAVSSMEFCQCKFDECDFR